METEKMNFTPKAFIFTIRELGYKPHQSIADIIDNSIAKNAKNIFFNIDTHYNTLRAKIFCKFTDNIFVF